MKKWGKSCLLGSAAALALGQAIVVTPAYADGDDFLELQRQIQALQAQLNEMQAKQADMEKTAVKAKWKGAPEFSNADGSFKMKMRGRIQSDFASVDGDGTYDYESKTEFRRARLGIQGNIAKNTKYKFEADFGKDDTSVALTDAYVEQKTSVGKFRVGQFNTANSMDELTSSTNSPFMERASFTDAFGFGRRLGVGYFNGGDNWSLQVSAHGENVDAKGGRDEGTAYGARVSYAPINEKDRMVHVGGSVVKREFEDTTSTVEYQVRPLVHQTGKFVSTDKLTADGDTFWGLEGAGVFGPAWAHAEYGSISPDGAGDPNFTGWFIQGGWFLTGENRAYKGSAGTWKRTKPINSVNDGGMGAWELALGYDSLDLEDSGIMGGTQESWIFGVNWYLNTYLKLQANYVMANIEDSFADAPTGAPADNDVNTIQFRAQIDW